MSDQNYQPPSIRNILLGILLFIVLVGLFINLPSAMKLVGNVFLYIPSQLGLIQRVRPGDVHTIDLRTASPTLVDIGKPGRYAVYTDDYDLLMNNVLNGVVWLRINSHTTGEPVKVVPVERGARPYDTSLAAGRPILIFEVSVPDSYEFGYYFRYAFITIVPDYTTGKEPVIVLAYTVQIAILLTFLGIVRYLYLQRHRTLPQSRGMVKTGRRIKGRAFWEAKNQKGKKETQKKQ
jgi:hypothetical protein